MFERKAAPAAGGDECTVVRDVQVQRVGIEAYRRLARWHYRGCEPRAPVSVFALVDTHPARFGIESVVGAIVYTMPVANLPIRDVVLHGRLCGLTRPQRLAWLNANVRTISRVVIDPRWRGLGLAARLVRETMPHVNTPVVESLAVMGPISGFFERAGMRSYPTPRPAHAVRLIEALTVVGVDEQAFVDPAQVDAHLAGLDRPARAFIEREMRLFLGAYGTRRHMPAGPQRTAFILSRLGGRAAYYIKIEA